MLRLLATAYHRNRAPSTSNRRPREQPGEAQEAPFSDRLVHRGLRMMQMAVLERFWRGLAVIFGGQRLVGGSGRAS